jgi:hypothetical protein
MFERIPFELVLTVSREVLLSQLELLDSEASAEEFVGLISANGDVHGDLLVPLDAEASNGVLSLRLDGLLVGEILEHLGGLGQLIAGLTSAQVKNELLNMDISHFIVELRLLLL